MSIFTRAQPMLDEFDAIIDHTFRDDPPMHGWRSKSYRIDPERQSIRPSVEGVPEGTGVHPLDPSYWMPDRRLTVELAYDVGDDSHLESVADHLSTCICEECGAPGRERDDGWIRTVCDEHAAAWGRR